MNQLVAASPRARRGWTALFHPSRHEMDTAAQPRDGLVVFAVMWGMAMMLSAASQTWFLRGGQGLGLAFLAWSTLGSAALLVMNPRKTSLLLIVAGLMTVMYLLLLPVASNNRTISLFMNTAILIAVGSQVIKGRTLYVDREAPYEQLRVVARGLLAVMYFYGIFHKINIDFLNPQTSCATALYQPLMKPLNLGHNLYGQYLAIASTFIVEVIAIVCLYWRRFFWVGLLISLPFHYVIPISGYSWYMDFSSLVFALYMVAVPREVASGLYSSGVSLLRQVPRLRAGSAAMVLFGTVWAAALVFAWLVAQSHPDRDGQLIWHSAWLIIWTIFGGVSMVLIVRAALLEQPYSEAKVRSRQRWWVLAIPATLFVMSASPYVGLKTESSIAMFSNLHTEGGVSNHLVFPTPPYIFGYQSRAARILESSDPSLNEQAMDGQFGLVEHDIALQLLSNPNMWVTYEMGSQRFERVTAATYTGHRPNWIERKLLVFKPIDWARPKVCSH